MQTLTSPNPARRRLTLLCAAAALAIGGAMALHPSQATEAAVKQ